MTDSPQPGSPSEPTNPYQDPYQAYTDPAYAGSAPPGPSYSPTSTSSTPNPTAPLPQYWTQTYPQGGPTTSLGEQPPEPPRGPRPWLWAVAGFAFAVVIGMVAWLVFVNTNPTRQETSIPAMPSSTTTRTPTPTTTPPLFPFPLPTITIPTAPTTTGNAGETEPVVYEVDGEGRAFIITYVAEGGVMQSEYLVMLPWHKEVDLTKPARDSASVTVTNSGNNVTCKITVGGTQVRENTGAYFTACIPTG